ncbi:MOSC domain-containing protein [Methyloglobulus sp.]|uniref:MOSC domain-containing protein n=1 Tax=Methyloglobulus sp. TaxID=2518622 RepID=UPI0032B85E34
MTNNTSVTVATLWRYPVKSMMGEELNGSEITAGGLLGDRAYALVDVETGKVISAKNPKKWPDFFSFRAAFTAPPLQDNMQPLWITLPDGTVLRSDQRDINEKLSQFLGHQVVLQTQSPKDAKLEQFWPEFEGEANEVSNEAVAGDAPQGTFFDYAALHLLTTSSMEAMQHHYPEGRFEVRRFRPNIMIDTAGLEGFVENDWVGKTIKIGSNLRLQITDPCPRCVMPTLAQGDLPQDNNIFKNGIAKNKPMVPFAGKELPSVGVYARVLTSGWVKRGDAIIIEG